MAESAVDHHLEAVRRRLGRRVEVEQLDAELAAGAVAVDIRPGELRALDGELPGAVVVGRNVLEWRLDPTSESHLEGVAAAGRRVIVVCNEGYASSLAAASLRDVGIDGATDLVGGFQAWRRHQEAPAATRGPS